MNNKSAGLKAAIMNVSGHAMVLEQTGDINYREPRRANPLGRYFMLSLAHP